MFDLPFLSYPFGVDFRGDFFKVSSMIIRLFLPIALALIFFLSACQTNEPVVAMQQLSIDSVTINRHQLRQGVRLHPVAVDSAVIRIYFSSAINVSKLDASLLFVNSSSNGIFQALPSSNPRELVLKATQKLNFLSTYHLYIHAGSNLGHSVADNYEYTFVSQLDSTDKFPRIADDSLLTRIQRQTFRYFWDHAHPVSGLARERFGASEMVTSGGSGFAAMSMLVAIERGFITRQEGFERLQKMVHFLNTQAQRFHGAFPHWINGTTGQVIAFSVKDNGADLVETGLLMQGLLTVQQYFKNGNATEKDMCATIQQLYEAVEWNFFQQNGRQALYWHWSPNYNWDMNMRISGWNESLIVYVLAASSPTYPISADVYTNGWTRNGGMRNGRSFYNITLPLGEDKGGPLFFAHYSFLGLDPRNLSDVYTCYMAQNIAHTRINRAYCIDNPRQHYGYSADSWGLTASDIPTGYTASSPTNDGGTIAPTAAIASLPYTPVESMQAIRFFYYILGDKLWGDYGFRDAYNLNLAWFANSYLAIDQGPIIVMIENHRTQLLWELFMQNTQVQAGLNILGIKY